MAYAMLGTTYHNLGEKTLAAEDTRKAYERRARVSEWEKFYIESHYYHFVTGDLEKARQTYELWQQMYPREQIPSVNLGNIYLMLGQYDKTLEEFLQAERMSEADALNAGNMVLAYTYLDRLDKAQAAANDAMTKKLDSAELRRNMYQVLFLKGDKSGMAEQVAWAAGKPGKENILLYMEAGTAAYEGRLEKAREISRRAATSAVAAGEKEMAAGCHAAAALWEALYGNVTDARQRAAETLAASNGRDAEYLAALALGIIGDTAKATELTDDLEKRFPEDTIVKFNYLPTLRAQLALNAGAPGKAVEALAAAAQYELGSPGQTTFWTNGYPVYLRGQALLASKEGTRAGAEFQKLLDWPGVVFNEPIGALARLGLARAYVLQGDTVKAKKTYAEFLELWKDADGGVPVLVSAKAEAGKV